jgi:hypothetical protein
VAFGSPGAQRTGLSGKRNQLKKMFEICKRRACARNSGVAHAEVRSRRNIQIELGLREALAEGQLSLRFQPLVEIATRSVVGLEAIRDQIGSATHNAERKRNGLCAAAVDMTSSCCRVGGQQLSCSTRGRAGARFRRGRHRNAQSCRSFGDGGRRSQAAAGFDKPR